MTTLASRSRSAVEASSSSSPSHPSQTDRPSLVSDGPPPSLVPRPPYSPPPPPPPPHPRAIHEPEEEADDLDLDLEPFDGHVWAPFVPDTVHGAECSVVSKRRSSRSRRIRSPPRIGIAQMQPHAPRPASPSASSVAFALALASATVGPSTVSALVLPIPGQAAHDRRWGTLRRRHDGRDDAAGAGSTATSTADTSTATGTDASGGTTAPASPTDNTGTSSDNTGTSSDNTGTDTGTGTETNTSPSTSTDVASPSSPPDSSLSPSPTDASTPAPPAASSPAPVDTSPPPSPTSTDTFTFVSPTSPTSPTAVVATPAPTTDITTSVPVTPIATATTDTALGLSLSLSLCVGLGCSESHTTTTAPTTSSALPTSSSSTTAPTPSTTTTTSATSTSTSAISTSTSATSTSTSASAASSSSTSTDATTTTSLSSSTSTTTTLTTSASSASTSSTVTTTTSSSSTLSSSSIATTSLSSSSSSFSSAPVTSSSLASSSFSESAPPSSTFSVSAPPSSSFTSLTSLSAPASSSSLPPLTSSSATSSLAVSTSVALLSTSVVPSSTSRMETSGVVNPQSSLSTSFVLTTMTFTTTDHAGHTETLTSVLQSGSLVPISGGSGNSDFTRNPGAVAGVVLGALVAVGAAAFWIFLAWRRHRTRQLEGAAISTAGAQPRARPPLDDGDLDDDEDGDVLQGRPMMAQRHRGGQLSFADALLTPNQIAYGAVALSAPGSEAMRSRVGENDGLMDMVDRGSSDDLAQSDSRNGSPSSPRPRSVAFGAAAAALEHVPPSPTAISSGHGHIPPSPTAISSVHGYAASSAGHTNTSGGAYTSGSAHGSGSNLHSDETRLTTNMWSSEGHTTLLSSPGYPSPKAGAGIYPISGGRRRSGSQGDLRQEDGSLMARRATSSVGHGSSSSGHGHAEGAYTAGPSSIGHGGGGQRASGWFEAPPSSYVPTQRSPSRSRERRESQQADSASPTRDKASRRASLLPKSLRWKPKRGSSVPADARDSVVVAPSSPIAMGAGGGGGGGSMRITRAAHPGRVPGWVESPSIQHRVGPSIASLSADVGSDPNAEFNPYAEVGGEGGAPTSWAWPGLTPGLTLPPLPTPDSEYVPEGLLRRLHDTTMGSSANLSLSDHHDYTRPVALANQRLHSSATVATRQTFNTEDSDAQTFYHDASAPQTPSEEPLRR